MKRRDLIKLLEAGGFVLKSTKGTMINIYEGKKRKGFRDIKKLVNF